jgi:hypothetical protein
MVMNRPGMRLMQRWGWLTLTFLLGIGSNGILLAKDVDQTVSISKYKITMDLRYYVPPTGNNSAAFPNGFPTGYGSGLTLKDIKPDGTIEFYGLTDRGPNGDGPACIQDGRMSTAKFFLTPQFVPQIGIITLKNGRAEVTGKLTIKDAAGDPVSGLPVGPDQVGFTNEVPLSETGYQFPFDANGLDPEGIAVDREGNFWICDEYGPFIIKLSPQGKQLKKYAPGNGLPEVLKHRQANRGFEALTISPDGTIYAAVQSTLDIDGKTKNTAQFIRIVALDPVTGGVKMYAYPLDVTAYTINKNAKIGDMCAVSDSKMVLIEQGKGTDGMRNILYLIDLSRATDINKLQTAGEELEFVNDLNGVSGLRLITKEKLLDLRKYGWTAEKAEGLTVLNDRRTIAIVNDNDFGLTMQVSDKLNGGQTEIGKYQMTAPKSFTYEQKPAQPKFKAAPVSPEDSRTYLWLVKLPVDRLAF